MNDEIIKVRSTENGQIIDVTVYSKRADQIEVMIGSGEHSVKCQPIPTSN